MSTSDFYLARAAESAQAAKDAKLDNVRERCLRAEAAWRTMADRLLRVEQKKRTDAAEKSVRVEAEAGTDPVPWPLTPFAHKAPPARD